MSVQLESGLVGRDEYAAKYSRDIEDRAAWLGSSAAKADSVEQLLAIVNGPIWQHLNHAHYAVLCRATVSS